MLASFKGLEEKEGWVRRPGVFSMEWHFHGVNRKGGDHLGLGSGGDIWGKSQNEEVTAERCGERVFLVEETARYGPSGRTGLGIIPDLQELQADCMEHRRERVEELRPERQVEANPAWAGLATVLGHTGQNENAGPLVWKAIKKKKWFYT